MKTAHSFFLAVCTGFLGFGIGRLTVLESALPVPPAVTKHTRSGATNETKKEAVSWNTFPPATPAQGASTNAPPPTQQRQEAAAEPNAGDLKELAELAEKDPAAALRLVATINHPRAKMAAITAARKLVKSQPALAAELTAALCLSQIGPDPFEHVANDWGAVDPLAAIAWGQKFEGEEKNGFLVRSWNGLLRSDHALDASRIREAAQALKQILQQGGESGEGDWEYAAAKLTEPLIARSRALGSPSETIKMLEDLGLVSDSYHKAAWKMLGTWLNEDGIAASGWISQLPPGEQRDKYIFRVIKYAQATDPTAVPHWMEALSTPHHRELAKEAQESGNWPRFD